MNIEIKPNERLDDLQCKGYKIIQDKESFCFGIDAVLLSNFCEIKKGASVVEFGTGTGIIPILLAAKSHASQINAFEIQGDMAKMAQRSIQLNNLSSRITIINDDLNNSLQHFEKASVDVVVTNPPYIIQNGGIVNPNSKKAISRHEIHCTLEDIIKNASSLLKQHGKFFMIHRPSRLVDIMYYCRKYKLEPKKIQFIRPTRDKKANIMLIKCVMNGNKELKYLDPITVYNDMGEYTQMIHDIYSKSNIESFGGGNNG